MWVYWEEIVFRHDGDRAGVQVSQFEMPFRECLLLSCKWERCGDMVCRSAQFGAGRYGEGEVCGIVLFIG